MMALEISPQNTLEIDSANSDYAGKWKNMGRERKGVPVYAMNGDHKSKTNRNHLNVIVLFKLHIWFKFRDLWTQKTFRFRYWLGLETAA